MSRRRVKCANGNTVERFYDRRSRSSVTLVKDECGNQVGEADYSGNRESAKFAFDAAVAANGGEFYKPAARCSARHRHPGAWTQAWLYSVQCGNMTTHPSGKCRLHRWADE